MVKNQFSVCHPLNSPGHRKIPLQSFISLLLDNMAHLTHFDQREDEDDPKGTDFRKNKKWQVDEEYRRKYGGNT